MFSGIRWLSIVDLGVSQLYLSEVKMANIKKWLNPNDLSNFEPLPVCDFGNGKFTLTDGHSRAFLAYTMGILCVPCVYDSDSIVSSEMGQILYKNDLCWCERFKIRSVMDLADRIVSDYVYQERWVQRCDKAYNLLAQTTLKQREKLQNLCPNLYLYGANEDVSVCFFENNEGESFSVSVM